MKTGMTTCPHCHYQETELALGSMGEFFYTKSSMKRDNYRGGVDTTERVPVVGCPRCGIVFIGVVAVEKSTSETIPTTEPATTSKSPAECRMRVGGFEEICHTLRDGLKMYEHSARRLLDHHDLPGANNLQKFPGQLEEVKAQINLVVCAIEDARLRLGKVLQYADDGVSILDKQPR